MIERHRTIGSFQTFFSAGETSSYPQLVEINAICRILDKNQLTEQGKGSISVAYGNRILINGKDIRLSTIGQDDLVEIIDYDPIKNTVLAIGKKNPHEETPVHWLVQRARHDIHAVVLLSNQTLAESLSGTLPLTEKETPPGTLDQAKEILKTLRNGKTIVIRKQGVFFAGFNLKEIEESIGKIKREG